MAGIALVTGGNRGIGLAIAQAFVQIEAEFTQRDRLIPLLVERAGPHLADEVGTLARLRRPQKSPWSRAPGLSCGCKRQRLCGICFKNT